jgi:hypothetical protein
MSKLSQCVLNPPEQTRLILGIAGGSMHGGPPQGLFPDTEDTPVVPRQVSGNKPVAGLIAGNLFAPERRVALGFGSMLGTTMPETAVHENGELEL